MPKGSYTPTPVKHPETGEVIWSGRGRKPTIVKRLEEEGKLAAKNKKDVNSPVTA